LRAFVDSLAQAGPTGQLARWRDWICPSVLGIETAQAAWMEDHVAEVARSLELRRSPHSCRPTLIVVVTSDAAGLAKELAEKAPISLSADGRWRLKRFVENDRPVRWLSVTDPCGYGCALPGSRLKRGTTPAFSTVLVIVVAGKVTGFSLADLGDYVALAALANPASDTEAPASSILSMFARPRTPGTQYALTESDRAFLTGLYRSGPEQTGQAQRNAIVRGRAEPPPSRARQ
jgi:hypothetical protein